MYLNMLFLLICLQIEGSCHVTLKKPMKHSVEWARLESSKTVSVSSYISDILHGTLEEPLYLFDWSLPLNCPDLAKQLVIPKYFVGKVYYFSQSLTKKYEQF